MAMLSAMPRAAYCGMWLVENRLEIPDCMRILIHRRLQDLPNCLKAHGNHKFAVLQQCITKSDAPAICQLETCLCSEAESMSIAELGMVCVTW